MARSAVDKVRELDTQRARLIAAAKAEVMKKVERAIKELDDLGFTYKLVADGDRRTVLKKAKRGEGRAESKMDLARYASFQLYRAHDARTHRGQTKKAPFTSQELVERGFRRT